MTTPDAHVPYEDASTPLEMRDDCEAATRNFRVPQPRRVATTMASTLVGAAPKRVTAPLVAVTDRLAKMAGSILD